MAANANMMAANSTRSERRGPDIVSPHADDGCFQSAATMVIMTEVVMANAADGFAGPNRFAAEHEVDDGQDLQQDGESEWGNPRLQGWRQR